MKDEIREILRYLRIENGHCSSELSYEETHLLLDYITNLQQEIHKQIHTSIVQKKQINNLQKRNSRQRLANQKQQDLILKLQEGYCKLKEECNKGIYDCTMEEYHAMANKNMELSLENEDYKSRVEKAVEYYKMHQQECVIGRNRDDKLIKDYYLPAKCSKVLLNILQNGSDENVKN